MIVVILLKQERRVGKLLTNNYISYTRRKVIILIASAFILVGAVLFNLLTGSSGASVGDIFKTIFDPGSAGIRLKAIVWDMRMPVAIMGILVGASLASAGSIMQTILNNPLASPYTLGVSAGAGVGASIVLVLGVGGLSILGQFLIPAFAFAFSLLACLGIYLVSRAKGFSSSILVLAGIGMVFFFQAFQSFLQYLSSAEVLQNIVFWTFGSLSKSNWTNLSIIAGVFAVTFFLFIKNSWKLTAMRLGDNRARSMGVNVDRLRKEMFILVSILTATTVAFVGSIGFIGIIGPHIARMIVGEDQRFFLPMSAISGAIILSTASAITKIIVPGAIFPIGIITSLIGVPFFFLLLLKRKAV